MQGAIERRGLRFLMALGITLASPTESRGIAPPRQSVEDRIERARTLYSDGRYDVAVPLVEDVCSELRAKQRERLQDLGACVGFLGVLHKSLGNSEQARLLLEESISIEETSEAMFHLAALHAEQGHYSRAEILYERTLRIDEEELGKAHDHVAADLNNLATIYREQGKYRRAEDLLHRAIAITERTQGPRSRGAGIAKLNLGWLYQLQGRYEAAGTLAEQAIDLFEETLGKEHILVAIGLNSRAESYRTLAKYQLAEQLYERALSIIENDLGPEHPQVATCLSNLGLLHRERGNYAKAELILKRALAIQEKALGPEHPALSTSLVNLGLLYHSRGDFQRAGAAFDRALTIARNTLAPKHPHMALILANIADLRIVQGRYRDAEKIFARAISIYEHSVGNTNPEIASIMVNLGALHRQQGRYIESEDVLNDALAILEESLGPDHPSIAACLNDLAVTYQARGEHAKAEPLMRQALDMDAKLLGEGHPTFARRLDGLGVLYLDQGQHQKAEPLLLRARSIWEEALGPDHHGLAVILGNLGRLELERRNYRTAEEFLGRALVIRERTLGHNHPKLGGTLTDLGLISNATGDYARAESLFLQGLSIFEDALGSHHPYVALELNHLAAVLVHRSEYEAAVQRQARAMGIENENLARAFVTPEDSRRNAYAAKMFVSTNQIVSLHLQGKPEHLLAAELAATAVLNRKGRVQDLTTQSYLTLRRSLPQKHQRLFDDIADVRSRYAAIAHQRSSGDGETADEHLRHLRLVEDEQDELWAKLSRLSPWTRALVEPVGLRELQVNLPGDSVAIEFINYETVFGARALDGLNEDRYAAYIIRPNGLDWVDLGPAEPIDEYVRAFREAIMRNTDSSATGHVLYDLIMKPVLDRIGLTNHVFLAPDGDLNLVPFEALVDEYGHYVVERFRLHYLTSSRDLLRPWTVEPVTDGPVLVVANPAGADLAGTEHESTLLTSFFGNAVDIRGAEATEPRLRAHRRPRILHIATHGTFGAGRPGHTLSDALVDDDRGLLGASVFEEPPPTQLDNPMLYSWLDVAVPSQLPHEHIDTTLDDGRLTAYEISGWDLRGTELVTLSACDTGQGTYQQGEGILGLRRAFAIAGAQTQVMSLWKVSDTATAKLMEGYYRRLLAGEGRSEAMRNTQLEMLRNPETRHPRDWAAFVVVGEWGPLSFVDPPSHAEPDPIAPRPRGCQASIDPYIDLSTLFVLLPILALAPRRRRTQRDH